MKYHTKNQLNIFEFHDSILSLVSFDKNNLVLSAEGLNIHNNVPENPFDCDMEILFSNITFTNTRFYSFEYPEARITDSNGNTYIEKSRIISEEKNSENHFINELNKKISVHGITLYEKNCKNFIKIQTNGVSVFTVDFSFEAVTVEWDEYLNKAWYESLK